MSSRDMTVRVNHEDGSFWAEVIDLPGCFASGETLDELREALEEAIPLNLYDDPAAGTLADVDGRNKPPVAGHMEVEEMRVKVPV